MNRSAFAVPAIVLFVSLVVWGAAMPPPNEERVHGVVVATHANYCEPKKIDGCTGTVTLAVPDETLTIKVPLGTPISAGCQVLSLGELPGRRVTVTEMGTDSGPVARAILAADARGREAC